MKIYRVLLLVCSVLLVACEEQALYADLSEQEANKMVALMYSAGLTAHKQADKDGTYSVLTDMKSFPDAVVLLQVNDLPERRFKSMIEVFEQERFVSSPLAERARLNFALSEELSRTLSTIDGVVEARVHLTMPEQKTLSRKTLSSSAAVLIKHRPGTDLASSRAKIKALVIDSIENLSYEDVTVAFFIQKSLVLPEKKLKPVLSNQGPLYIAKLQFLNAPGLTLLGVLLVMIGLIWCVLALLRTKNQTCLIQIDTSNNDATKDR